VLESPLAVLRSRRRKNGCCRRVTLRITRRALRSICAAFVCVCAAPYLALACTAGIYTCTPAYWPSFAARETQGQLALNDAPAPRLGVPSTLNVGGVALDIACTSSSVRACVTAGHAGGDNGAHERVHSRRRTFRCLPPPPAHTMPLSPHASLAHGGCAISLRRTRLLRLLPARISP